MGRDWAPKYTDEQREALIAEVLEHGATGSETARRAAQGTLRARLEPFAVPAPTVRDLAAKRRRRDQLAHDRAIGPSAVVANTCDRLAAMLTQEVDKYERAVRKGRATDPAKLRELARAAREIATLERTIAPKRPAAAKPAQKSKSKPAGDLIDQLAGETRRDDSSSAETAQEDASRQPTDVDGETSGGERSERINAAREHANQNDGATTREGLWDARSVRSDVEAVIRAASSSGV